MAEVYPQRRPGRTRGALPGTLAKGHPCPPDPPRGNKNSAREVPMKRPMLSAMRRLPACQNCVKRINRIPIHMVAVLLQGAAASHPPGIPPSNFLCFYSFAERSYKNAHVAAPPATGNEIIAPGRQSGRMREKTVVSLFFIIPGKIEVCNRAKKNLRNFVLSP